MVDLTPEQELEQDLRLIEQVVLNPAWAVVMKRLNNAYDYFVDRMMDVEVSLEDSRRFRERALAFKTLLDLPAWIREENKKIPKPPQDFPDDGEQPDDGGE